MKILVILNYQREIPPFWQMQIKYARNIFERIIFVTPKLRNDNSDTITSNTTQVVEI